MRNRKALIIAFALCISFVFGNSFDSEVHASEKTEDSGIKYEYENYSDISETVQSETGITMYLDSFEKIGNVYQAVYSEAGTSQSAINEAASPLIVVSVSKQVVKTYSNFDSVPSSISYEEYNSTYNTWMKGTLFLIKTERLGTTWYATFEGTLMGNI